MLDATTQTLAWCVIFFVASAGASSAYLTASEIFPMETRAMAIAFFYAIGTAAGGITGPLLFGPLIDSGKVTNVFYGYILGAALMIAGGLVDALEGRRGGAAQPRGHRGAALDRGRARHRAVPRPREQRFARAGRAVSVRAAPR